MDEHLTTYENPFKFSGKELDDITGLYDHGARSRNPVSTLWYGVDPLFEKYPDFSPYNYCEENPVKLVDLDGRDWITATYEGESFYYYDENVHSQDDVKALYYNGENRDSYDITYVGETGSYTSETDGYFEFNSDASYSHNGETKKVEYYHKGVLHIGSSKHTTTPKDSKSNNNWYGNYLGPNNPNVYGNEVLYSYAIPPIDDLDYAAFLHDIGYDDKKTAGRFDAVLNYKVSYEDFSLAVRSFNVSSNKSMKKALLSKLTGSLFFFISTYKSQTEYQISKTK